MVEFGLKLEDNQVSEWVDKYIDYNKLKMLIEEIEQLTAKQKELEKRNPNLARVITEKILQNPNGAENKFPASNIKSEKKSEMGTLLPPLSIENFESSSYGTIRETLTNVASYFKVNSFEDRLQKLHQRKISYQNEFAEIIQKEMEKVQCFYVEKFKEIEAEFTLLTMNCPDEIRHRKLDKSSIHSTTRLLITTNEDYEYEHRAKEENSIQRAIIDLHRNTKLLLNFALINYTGFIKIIKKYNKKVGSSNEDFQEKMNNLPKVGKEAELLAYDMESTYAQWFCGGNIREAQIKMLPKKGDNLNMDWSQLHLGYRLGMCAILTVWICWDCVYGYIFEGNPSIGGRKTFPVFRGCGGLLVFHWFWACSTFVWSRFRINYIYLFDFDPRIVETPLTIFGDVIDETLVYLILTLLYYKAGAHDMPGILPTRAYPFMLILYTLKRLIYPLRTRVPLWKTILKVITSPLKSPTFFHTVVGDYFTSMVKVFQDLLWIICFVFSGDFLRSEDDLGDHPYAWKDAFWYKYVAIPLICLAPLWFRFNQCIRRYYDTNQRFPHLANAFKYALSQCVTLFGAFHPLYLMHSHTEDAIWGTNLFQIFWMGLFVCSSMYSWFWDVYMDWGLGRVNHALLCDRLMFKKNIYYYSAIFADLFLRFMWVLTLIPPQSGAKFELPYYLSAISMVLELFRRTVWSFFRLENEHRSNTSQFRRVDFVPLHFDTGHNHKYKKTEEKRGWNVLAEVFAVTIAVVAFSISSIIAARHA